MRLRQVAAVILASVLVAPPYLLAAPLGALQVNLTSTAGRALAGFELDLVNLDTGHVVKARTDASGAFTAQLPPGRYAFDSSRGYLVRGPRVVTLAPGQSLSAALSLALSADGGLQVNHEAVSCFIADQYPQLQAAIEPAGNVAEARVYFHSAKSGEFYYVKATLGPGGWTARLPRPNVDAGPITYYVSATGKDFTESRTAEFSAKVLAKGRQGECGGKVAAVGPGGGVTVFSAGGAAVAPAGFAGASVAAAGAAAAGVAGAAAAGGGILGLSTAAAVAAGVAVAGGVATAVAVSGGGSPSR